MGIAYNTSIVRNGLVLHLDAANVKSYPGAGSTWYDLSGNGNNGTLVNSVGYSTDNKGTMTFDGVDDGVNVLHSSSIYMGTNDWTYGGWVMFNSIPNSSFHPFVKDDYEYGIWWNGSQVRPHFNPGTNSIIYFSTFSYTFTPNRWYNLISTWRNSTQYIEVFIDGNIVYGNTRTSSASGRSLNNLPLRLCNDTDTSSKLSFFSAYNRALSEAEIQQNFEATRRRYGI